MHRTVTTLALVVTLVCGWGSVDVLAQELSLNIESFDVVGPNPLSERDTRKLLKPYLGRHEGIEPVQQAASALEEVLHDQGFAFYVVSVPPQPITSSNIRLDVDVFPINEIGVTGNKHFSEENILRSLPALKLGDSPNTRDVSRSLRVANVHPSKRLRLKFASPDDGQGVPAQVQARDAKPGSLFFWANNTGTEDTGELRLGVGFQHTNLFDRDHVGMLTWTTSPDQDADVSQFGLSYQVPLYRAGGLINLLAARSDIDTGTVADVFNVAGKGDAYALQYTQLFPKIGSYEHQLALGIEDKLFDNDIDFEGQPIGVDVRSRPLYLRYVGKRKGERFDWDFKASYFQNLDSGEFNSDADYAATRAGADADWRVARLGAALKTHFGDWTVFLGADAQFADEPLIPGEQFGLVGANAVRGFEEREITSDKGYAATIQLWTPTWRDLQLILFADAASGDLEDPLPGQVASEEVTSAGVGLRWTWRQTLALNVTWAKVIDGADPEGVGTTRDDDEYVHFDLVVRR